MPDRVNSNEMPLPTYSRRFGRTYHGLDAVDANLCYCRIGKMDADCRLRVSKSQWGELGERATPAGIVYMDLAFDQPTDCSLISASVTITLEGENSDGHRKRDYHRFARLRRQRTVEEDEASVDLRMTDHYGPKSLSGEPSRVTVKRMRNITPEVNVMGSGGGGIGINKEKQLDYESRWTFTGRLLSTPPHSAYRTLKWELHEGDPDYQAMRRNTFHTAFAFHHGNSPLLMKVEIQGRLHRSRDRFRNRVRQLRFPDPYKKDQGLSEILVRPDIGHHRAPRRLDSLAQGLSHAMERENMLQTSVQLPNALPVSFEEVSDENGIAVTEPKQGNDLAIPSRLHMPRNLSSASTLVSPTTLGDAPNQATTDSISPRSADNLRYESGINQVKGREVGDGSSLAPQESPSAPITQPETAQETLDIFFQFPLFLAVLRVVGNFLVLLLGEQKAREPPQDKKDEDPSRLLLLTSNDDHKVVNAGQAHVVGSKHSCQGRAGDC